MSDRDPPTASRADSAVRARFESGDGAGPARRLVRVIVYTDATSLGGAELSLGTLLASLGEHVRATVLGVDRELVSWLAGQRPGTQARIVPEVRNKWDLKAIAAHLRVVAELQPDILHANLRRLWSCQYGIAAGLLVPGVRVLAVEQTEPTPPPHAVQRRYKRLVSRRLAAHVAVGARTARLVEANVGLPEGSVRTIYNGVSDDRVGGAPHEFSSPVVGSLGRVVEEKGLECLVRVLPSLPQVTAVVVGDGPDRHRLERLASALGVENRFVITGWSAQPRGYLRSFELLVLPSRSEGFPRSVVEAMLARLAVVATDVGSVREAVVHGETGLLVPPDDPTALAEAIGVLLSDPGRRARMGERGRARALRRFTAEAMVGDFEALYEELRNDGPPDG